MTMYINSIGYYIPAKRINNEYFTKNNRLTDECISQRTGIQTQSRTPNSETMDYMCNEAVKNATPKLPYNIQDVDMAIFASYTASDTVGTTAHYIQRGYKMPYGKDVFIHACTYIAQGTKDIVETNGYNFDDLSDFIGHQANMRVLKNVTKQLHIDESKILSNIEELENTGSISVLLVLAQNVSLFKTGNLICLSVFGGGYSTGSCLIKVS